MTNKMTNTTIIVDDTMEIRGFEFKTRIGIAEDGTYCAETRLVLGKGMEDVHYGEFETITDALKFTIGQAFDIEWDAKDHFEEV